jgi:hypothetical protein
MDSGSGIDTANIDLSKLTDRDKQELQAFITNETQVSLSATALQTSRLILFSESKNPAMLVLRYSSYLQVSRTPPCSDAFNFALRKGSTASSAS